MGSRVMTFQSAQKYLQLMMSVWLISSVLSNCQFPEFINQHDVWTMTNADGGTLTAYIKPYVMQAKYCAYAGASCEHFQRQCFEDMGDNKYIVKHQVSSTKNAQTYYLCLEFVYRSQTILQIKQSSVKDKPYETICDDVVLNNWLLISSSAYGKAKPIKCPFTGGYNLHISNENSDVACSKHMVSPRLESECQAGAGITLDFKHEDCIPKGLKNMNMKLHQNVDCIASWSLNNFEFVVLRPDAEHVLCLRIKKPLDNIRHAYLFMDLVCDPGNSVGRPQDTNKFLSIRFERNIIYSVCENEFDGCNDEQVCLTDVQKYCQRTCGQCQPDKTCVFPEFLRRRWAIYNRKYDQMKKVKYLDISNYEMEFPDVGRFQCLYNNVSSKHRTVLLHTFENGCYPKFTCMETYYASDTVRQFRLGRQIDWPLFPLRKVKEQVCRSHQFKTHIRIGDTKEEMKTPKITVVDPSYIRSVNCKLGYEFRNHMNGLYFKEADRCDGCVYHDNSINPQQFDVRTISCPDSEKFLQYICLASFKFDNETSAVVTGTRTYRRNIRQFLCWIFTGEGKYRQIIVLDAADCNQIEFKKALVGDIEPRSMFTVMEKPPKQCPTSYEDPVFRPTTTPSHKPNKPSFKSSPEPEKSKSIPDVLVSTNYKAVHDQSIVSKNQQTDNNTNFASIVKGSKTLFLVIVLWSNTLF